MSPRRYSFIVALLASATALHAVSPKPEAPKPEEPKMDPPPPYVLKKRSSFTAPADVQRAPFWPIGWVKHRAGTVIAATQEAPLPTAKVTLDAKNFRVTSILLGTGTTPSLAVINGRAYSEGEFLRMPKTPGSLPVRIRVQRINDGNVILQNADQTLVANLSRTELQQKKPEELLLDPDR